MFAKYFSATFLLLALFFFPSDKVQYLKEYYDNGVLKAEGWSQKESKTGYWKFYFRNGKKSEEGHFDHNQRKDYWFYYHSNGNLMKEGHFVNGKKANWWSFYNRKGIIIHKCQLNMGIKNGYCLKYDNEDISSAEKYKNGKKIKEWFSFSSFKKENNMSDLK
ncbi:MAG: hypothetical protein COA50_00950 [Flavobacteriaceae bacterium]|nr:MAG: hypothetical protein COA50_00950 [Flavobacteriaceae bacterium]